MTHNMRYYCILFLSAIIIFLNFTIMPRTIATAGDLTISDGASHDIPFDIASGAITFSGSGCTLNLPDSSTAVTSGSAVTVEADTTAVITGTEFDNMGVISRYDLTVASTTLISGSSSTTSLTIMNPGSNNLGTFTAGDKTSLTIQNDDSNFTTVGQVSLSSLTLNNNATNGFTINNNSGNILDLGDVSVTTSGKLIIDSTSSSSGYVSATTQSIIDLDVQGYGKYASTGTALKYTSKLGTVNLAADSAGSSYSDINFTVSLGETQVTSLNVTSNKHATINVSNAGVLTASATTIGTGTSDTEADKGNSTLLLILNSGDTTPGTCALGALSMGNGTLTIDDSNSTAAAQTVTATTLTLTGASMLNGNNEGVVHVIKLTSDTFTAAGHTLYYNGDRIKLVNNAGSEISDANLVNTVTASPKITSDTTINSNKEYLGIELATDAGATITVNNSSTAGIVGSTVLNNNTLTVDTGSTFNQLNDNSTNEADFSGANGTVNLGGALNFANTNSSSGKNIIGTLNTTSNSAEISGNSLEISTLNIDNAENLTLKNNATISTGGTVSNSGTLILDGATLNTSSTNLNLGTIASGVSDSKINVTAGTTTATATSATKTDVDVSSGATFATAATSSMDKITLKGSSSSNTGTLSITAGTTTLNELEAASHGTVSIAKDASLDVTTGTTVGTGTAEAQSDVSTNTLTVSADHTSSGSVDLGALTLGNGTLTLDDSNSTAAALTISADSLSLTGASMVTGNDSSIIHKLKISDNALTANGKYLYYDSSKVLLVGSDGSTAITSSYLKDAKTANPVITSTLSITSDSEYKGIELINDNENISIAGNVTVGIFGSITVQKESSYIAMHKNSTLNVFNDTDTGTADIKASTIYLKNGSSLNLQNTPSSADANYIETVDICDYCSNNTISSTNNVTINNLNLHLTNGSNVNLTGKVTINKFRPNTSSSNFLNLNGCDLTLNQVHDEIVTFIKGNNNKLTVNAPTYKEAMSLIAVDSTLDQYNGSVGALLIAITTETADSTIKLYDSYIQNYSYIYLSGNYNTNNTLSAADDTGYHATLDLTNYNDLNMSGRNYIKIETRSNSTGRIILPSTLNTSIQLDHIMTNSNATTFISLESNYDTSSIFNSLLLADNSTLNICDSGNDNISSLNFNTIETSGSTPSHIVADGDGSGGTDIISADSFSLNNTLIYDSSKLSILQNGVTYTSDNLIDTYSAQAETAAAGESVDLNTNTALSSLDISANGASATVQEGTTTVVTGNTTLGNNTLNVTEGSNLVSTGTITGTSSSTITLAGSSSMTVTGTSNTTGTLQVTGTNSGTATITGGGTIDADKVLINSDNTLAIAGRSVLDCSGSTTDTNIDGTVTITDSSQIKLASTTTDVAKLITSGSGGTISGNGQNQTKIITGDADLEGHTTVTDTTLYLDGNQSASISASTLELIDSTFEVGEKVYITGVNADVNDSHIEALGIAAGNTSTINNHSTLDNNTLGLLDVVAGSTAGYTTSLDVDNTAATASIFNITTANVTGDATGGAATLNFKATGDTNNVVQDINLTTLNIKGVDATGTATVTSQNHTDLEVETINFTGTTGIFDNQVAYASTSATTAKLGAVNVGTESGDAATGTLKSTVSDAKTTITTATVTGGTSAGTLNISGDDANDVFAITTLNLAGADAVTDAVMTVNNNSSVNIATTALASGMFGTINNNANTTFTDGTINGELKIAGATLNLANGTFTIGSTGKLDVSANNMTVDNSDKLIFDLGTNSDSADNIVDTAKTYATATGNITATRTGTAIENVYGREGISGETYLDVISFAGGVGAAADDVLQTDDYLRTYTLKDQDGEGDAFDILVSTNTSGITSTINASGGTSQDASDIEELVNKQASADAAGGEYIAQVLNMSARDQITAMEEKRGEDATTSSTQASIQTISSASGAVKNQMTSFRSGNLSAGMTSSFSSSGATAALNDMADAQTLEDAYSSVGYTADTAEDDYRKYQVWANGFGGFGEQGSTDNSRGYDFHNIGTMVGIDYRLSQELRLGGLLGYSYNVTKIYKNSGDSKDNAIRTGAYASYNWNNFFVDFSPTCGIHILESKRNLNTGKIATGERTGFDFNINTTVGYTFNFQNNLMLTPSFSLGYTMFYDPEYTETGAGVQNNKFDSFTSNSLLQDIGIKAGKLFRHSDTLSFLPEVWGGWEVEYLNTGGDRNSTTSASLFSNTYTSSMDGMATHRGYWGVGLTALIRDNISVYGRYDHKIWEKGFNVGFSAGIKVTF